MRGITYKFIPRWRLVAGDRNHFVWEARVYIEKNGLASGMWTRPCDTRWGARRVAKRQARKFEKANKRGEFVF